MTIIGKLAQHNTDRQATIQRLNKLADVGCISPEALPLDDVRAVARDRLQRCVPRAVVRIEHMMEVAKKPYVAYSGGKDSAVVLALCESLGLQIPAVWSDDEMEYPETVAHMEALNEIAWFEGEKFHILQGGSVHGGWFSPWASEPYWRPPLTGMLNIPGSSTSRARLLGFDGVFLGLRAQESRRRRDWLIQHPNGMYRARTDPETGALGELRCNPIWDWDEASVWAYLDKHDIRINKAYATYASTEIPRPKWRIGPLPLARRSELAQGWPKTLRRLEARYGARWSK